MSSVARNVAIAVFGVVVLLAWWTMRGGPAGHDSRDGIPGKVFEGGASIVVEGECSHPGSMAASFGSVNASGESRLLETREHVGPGQHQWRIEVPPGTSGYIELGIVNPPVGATSRVALVVNGRKVAEDLQTLDAPLKEGYAFSSQLHVEDYAAGRVE